MLKKTSGSGVYVPQAKLQITEPGGYFAALSSDERKLQVIMKIRLM